MLTLDNIKEINGRYYDEHGKDVTDVIFGNWVDLDDVKEPETVEEVEGEDYEDNNEHKTDDEVDDEFVDIQNGNLGSDGEDVDDGGKLGTDAPMDKRAMWTPDLNGEGYIRRTRKVKTDKGYVNAIPKKWPYPTDPEEEIPADAVELPVDWGEVNRDIGNFAGDYDIWLNYYNDTMREIQDDIITLINGDPSQESHGRGLNLEDDYPLMKPGVTFEELVKIFHQRIRMGLKLGFFDRPNGKPPVQNAGSGSIDADKFEDKLKKALEERNKEVIENGQDVASGGGED